MSEVAGLLADLKAGKSTLDEVVAKFAGVKWSAPRKPLQGDAFWKDQADDPVPDDGPATDLMQAYYDGTITDEQYAALYAAVPGGGGGEGDAPAEDTGAAPAVPVRTAPLAAPKVAARGQ